MQVQQQQLQEQQRQAEELMAQLIEHLGEWRANYNNGGGEQRPYQDQPPWLRVEVLKKGKDIKKFLLTFKREIVWAGIGEDEWVMTLAKFLSGLARDVCSNQDAHVDYETLKDAIPNVRAPIDLHAILG